MYCFILYILRSMPPLPEFEYIIVYCLLSIGSIGSRGPRSNMIFYQIKVGTSIIPLFRVIFSGKYIYFLY